MAWIKRNLLFVIGTVIAFVLMGLAGFYLFTKWQLNNEVWDKLNTDYAELKRLSEAKPHPGNSKVDNIKAAKDQQQELRAFLQKTRGGFVRIPPIPELPTLTDRDFSAALSRTIDQLRRDATNNANVALPAGASPGEYNFSFQAERNKVVFVPAGLPALSVQLGEVKAICGVLFAARVNALDGIRRERVSADDAAGQLADYLGEKTTTNELATLTPYEVTFRCFTPELAAVLTGLAGSPHALVVKTINVEAAPVVVPDVAAVAPTPQPVYIPQPRPMSKADGESAFRSRYGLDGSRPPPQQQPVAMQLPPPGPTGPVGKGGLPVALDEHQLKVTLLIEIIKLLPPKGI
jgi:hypothetical protein